MVLFPVVLVVMVLVVLVVMVLVVLQGLSHHASLTFRWGRV